LGCLGLEKALRAVILQRSIEIGWLLHMMVVVVVNFQFRFLLLVIAESDDATKADESHQTEDNVGKLGRGGAVY
jgi:hypothetical protein